MKPTINQQFLEVLTMRHTGHVLHQLVEAQSTNWTRLGHSKVAECVSLETKAHITAACDTPLVPELIRQTKSCISVNPMVRCRTQSRVSPARQVHFDLKSIHYHTLYMWQFKWSGQSYSLFLWLFCRLVLVAQNLTSRSAVIPLVSDCRYCLQMTVKTVRAAH